MPKPGFVYIETNRAHTVLYTGVTGNLAKRAYQHREGLIPGFAQRYNVRKLVWYEASDDIRFAIEREKQIKAGSRQRKLDLINAINPGWRDLSEDIC